MKIGRGKNISQRKKIIFYFVFATCNFIILLTKSATSPSLPLAPSGKKPTDMSKLEDLDNLYKRTISKLSTADRLSYCRQQLDRLQHIPSPYLTEILKEIIKATQEEIKIINNK